MERNQFSQLIVEHQRLIYKVCHLYADIPADVEDLFQEIVLNLWRSRSSFQQRSAISTWIYRVALNTAITQFRKAKRQAEHESREEILDLASPTSETNEEREELYAAIKKLNKIEKGLILLYLEDRSYREIAEVMGISENYVGVQLSRIRNKLKHLANPLE
ncbi:MAG: sigma-70 family RNA polymerase sigma factor [Chloroflexota bacterium]